MHSTSARFVRMLIGLLIIAGAVQSLRQHWGDIQLAPLQWQVRSTYVLEAIGLVFASYAALVVAWYGISYGWRQNISLMGAARVWAKTNLMRYLPGPRGGAIEASKIAEANGISDGSSMGAIIFPRLISLATATVAASAFFILNRLESIGIVATVGFIAMAVAVVGIIMLTSASFTWRLGIDYGRPEAVKAVEPEALGLALFADALAVVGHGMALFLLARGTLGGIEFSFAAATGGVAGSYVAARVFPVFPAGFLVREAALFILINGALGTAPALAVTVIWRVLLTATEFLAAVPFALFRSPARG